MIVAIHVPKTAGMSFRLRLAASYGGRMLQDYEDWIGWDDLNLSAERTRNQRDQLLRDYDLIYGHFIADKYAGLFPTTDLTAFFRNPYQQAASHYQFLQRHPEIDHPLIRAFHELRPSLPELIAELPDFQLRYLGRTPLEDLTMVGLTEQYERSVALFEAVFGRKLPPETERGHANPNRQGHSYEIDPAVRRAVDVHRAGDVELYRRACERFGRLAARYGI
ncbi:MAG: hypothetical protein ABSH47_22640 [Bryobacteraceae bacterium]|jgi:hypothetical protein